MRNCYYNMLLTTVLTCMLLECHAARSDASGGAADEEAAYIRVITQRADKIVESLDISDSTKATRVRDLIAQQYRRLREIHDERDAKIDQTKDTGGADPAIVSAWTGAARAQASLKQFHLHHYFIARLAVELTPEQVDKVKDGMTYGVVRVTYKQYLELLPALTEEQKREILANLLEAREHAMDGGSSDEKHAIFGKYKGRINNDLSAAGYDLKQAEKDWAARQKSGLKSDIE